MFDLTVVTCEIILFGLLIAGAITDTLKFQLPNWLTFATALSAIPWLFLMFPIWPDSVLHLLAGPIFLVVGVVLLRFDLIGGGDVKWLAALAIWIGPSLDLIRFLMLTGFAGGFLAIIVLILGRFRINYGIQNGKRHLPYGVAIALAGIDFWLRHSHLSQEILALYSSPVLP